MIIDKVLVTIAGIAGIVFTYWFFLAKKEEVVVSVKDSVNITVEGGYSPDIISIPKGKTTKITFLRKDASDCLEEVVLSAFKIRKTLPLNEEVTIELTPKQSGEFPFSCGMNMYHGKIIVR